MKKEQVILRQETEHHKHFRPHNKSGLQLKQNRNMCYYTKVQRKMRVLYMQWLDSLDENEGKSKLNIQQRGANYGIPEKGRPNERWQTRSVRLVLW